MGPLHRFRDREHLNRMISAIRGSGISVTDDRSANTIGTYIFRKGLGKVVGAIGAEEWESMMYFGFGHPFNPIFWYSDGKLLKQIESIFLSQGSERIESIGNEHAVRTNREQESAPNP